MIKQYTFLQEFVGTAVLGGLTALSALGLKNTVQNNSFNNRFVNYMIKELNKCPPNDRNRAIQIIQKYSNLNQTYNVTDKKIKKRVSQFQYHLQNNYIIPMMNIVNNTKDVNWKQTLINYLINNSKKIRNKNNLNALVQGASLAASGAGLAGVQGATAVTSALFAARNVSDQLKYFNGQRYISKMLKDIKNCPDNDRQQASKIVEQYCFNISKYLETQATKAQKPIPFNIQNKMRMEFLNPLLRIINNPKNNYWKIQVIDFITENRIQQSVSHIANTIAFCILPKVIK